MKVGIGVRIDVSKIDKSRLYEGKKGKYLDLTTFVNLDEQDQYGHNGFVTQSQTKEERESGENMPILGNVKVFYKGGQSSKAPAPAPPAAGFDDDIPFAPSIHERVL